MQGIRDASIKASHPHSYLVFFDLFSWNIEKVLSRADAEYILTKNAAFGNLIVRQRTPTNASDQSTLAVSINLRGEP